MDTQKNLLQVIGDWWAARKAQEPTKLSHPGGLGCLLHRLLVEPEQARTETPTVGLAA